MYMYIYIYKLLLLVAVNEGRGHFFWRRRRVYLSRSYKALRPLTVYLLSHNLLKGK